MRLRFPVVAAALSLFFLPALDLAAPARAQDAPQQTDFKAGEVPRPEWPAQAVRAPLSIVVSFFFFTPKTAYEILKKGGNAVDAAVAVAFALAVVHPSAGNLGGGGFLLVRLADGRAGFVDYREAAPGRATREMYIRPDGTLESDAATIGYRSVGVPGTVAGLELALRTYGTMKLAAVMAPALRLAEQGFPVSEKLARSLGAARPRLERFSASRRIFLNDGTLFEPGQVLRQPELAATLRRIARGGAAEFYRGKTARDLTDAVGRMGGLLSREDLANYQAKLREPLRAKYSASGNEWEVIASPPPSSGGVAIIEALNMMTGVELKSWDDRRRSTGWPKRCAAFLPTAPRTWPTRILLACPSAGSLTRVMPLRCAPQLTRSGRLRAAQYALATLAGSTARRRPLGRHKLRLSAKGRTLHTCRSWTPPEMRWPTLSPSTTATDRA